MGNSVFARIGINRAIGLPHPIWNSLGKARQAAKATAHLTMRPEMIGHVADNAIGEHWYLEASYAGFHADKLRSGELSLSVFLLEGNESCRRDRLIGATLIKLGEAEAVRLAARAEPEVIETKIGTWQAISRVLGQIHEGVISHGACPNQDILPWDEPYKKQDVDITVKGDLKVERTLKQVRGVLQRIEKKFPPSADLFRMMLQALPPDRVDVLKDQIREEKGSVNSSV
ncbi:MAG: hypothetical protein JW873_02700 [Candidatus Saganbacteria bacterium]|nr:hypothetical protein [Candidatus Saganbacteria bacterium]